MGLPQSMAVMLQQILSAKRIGHFLQARDVDYLLEPAIDSQAIPQVGDKIFIKGTVAWHAPPSDDPQSYASTNTNGNSLAATNSSHVFKLQDLDVEFPRGEITLVAGKFGSGKSLLLLSLLGEARLLEGEISYLLSNCLDPLEAESADWTLQKTGVAYVPQVSCGSFGKTSAVLRVCRLPGYKVSVSGKTSSLACPWTLTDTVLLSMCVSLMLWHPVLSLV